MTKPNLVKRLVRPLAILCMLVAIALPQSTAAIAAPSSGSTLEHCHKSTCYGKDPVETVCMIDVKTIAAMKVPTSGGMLELRWSKNCGTGWGRYSRPNRGGYMIGHASVFATTSLAPFVTQRNADSVDGTGSYWTNMVPDEEAFCTYVEIVISKLSDGGMYHDEVATLTSDKLCSVYE